MTGPIGPTFFDPPFPETPMPKHVLVKLEQELRAIKQALLVEIPLEIARAAGQGDLSENAEYEQALAKRDMFQNKLVTLEKRIAEVASLRFQSHDPGPGLRRGIYVHPGPSGGTGWPRPASQHQFPHRHGAGGSGRGQ